MKKLGILMLIFAFMAGVGMVSNNAVAATDSETTDVNLDIVSTIALDCGDSVTMGSITGTGNSDLTSNDVSCNIKTNNTAGYKLEWLASATSYMENVNGDQIAAYTPESVDTPETWAVDAAASEWGARLKTTSTDDNTADFGTADPTGVAYDTADVKWLNVATTNRQIVSRSTETDQAGSDEVITFGAEVGANKWQPTGTYDIDVVFTATTL